MNSNQNRDNAIFCGDYMIRYLGKTQVLNERWLYEYKL